MDAEESLVRRAQDGDRASFEELLRRTSRLIYARLYLETDRPDRAEDLLQDTYLVAWRSVGQLADPRTFRPWMMAIAQNVAIDAARRESRKKRAAIAAIVEAKGRVTKSDLKKHDAGQFGAVINCEVASEASGPLQDRLKQLGKVSRLDIARQQTADGQGLPVELQVKRRESCFAISLYNLANVQPRETVNLTLAVADPETTYKALLARVEKAGGRVVSSQLNREQADQSTASIHFETRAADAEAVEADVKLLGERVKFAVTENPDTQNVTQSKRGFKVQILSMAHVLPRHTATIQLGAPDVPAAYRALQEAATKANARVINATLNERNRQSVTALLDVELRTGEDETAFRTAMSAAGAIIAQTVERAAQTQNVIETKVRLQITLIDAKQIPPRETTTLRIETDQVIEVSSQISALISEVKGVMVQQDLAHEANGRMRGYFVFDVPLAAAPSVVQKLRAAGTVRSQQSSRNPQVPDSDLATARLDLTISNAELIVPPGEGFGAQIRSGLQTSFKAISVSLIMVVVGLCVVLPWGLVLWGGWKLIARLRRKAPPAAAT
ncbi:MAG: hypothetical protein HYY16_02295 [Planctomycetes bacterium]|nr:hypothetical protein [Planctomycetota bacterium]